jgi:hypothetical protein
MKKSAAAALVMLFAMNTAFAEVSHSDSVNLKSGKRIQQEADRRMRAHQSARTQIQGYSKNSC